MTSHNFSAEEAVARETDAIIEQHIADLEDKNEERPLPDEEKERLDDVLEPHPVVRNFLALDEDARTKRLENLRRAGRQKELNLIEAALEQTNNSFEHGEDTEYDAGDNDFPAEDDTEDTPYYLWAVAQDMGVNPTDAMNDPEVLAQWNNPEFSHLAPHRRAELALLSSPSAREQSIRRQAQTTAEGLFRAQRSHMPFGSDSVSTPRQKSLEEMSREEFEEWFDTHF